MANAPTASNKGRFSTFDTAISFLTGLKTYHEDKTKKKKIPASEDSLVKGRRSLFKKFFILGL
jgi:hypothetical protein